MFTKTGMPAIEFSPVGVPRGVWVVSSDCSGMPLCVITQSANVCGAFAVSLGSIPGAGMLVAPCLHGGCSLMENS